MIDTDPFAVPVLFIIGLFFVMYVIVPFLSSFTYHGDNIKYVHEDGTVFYNPYELDDYYKKKELLNA